MMPSKASATCPYRYVMGILAAAAIAGPYMKPIWKELDETTKIDVKLVLGSAIFAATMTGSAYLLHSCNTKNVAEEEQ